MTQGPEERTQLHRRIRQQEVVAELGQRALETDDIDQLMYEASMAVAETLNNEYAKVLELLPGGEHVLLRQGVGWRDGLVGSAKVPTDLDSQAGYTLLSERPIIVDDLRTEVRFSGPELLTSHDVVSGISVIIGSIDNPWGVLGTHTTERREFTEYDANFVQSVANVLASAIKNDAAHRQLREIHGRITNGIIGLNEEWQFTHVNPQAEDILGYDAEELVGRNIWEMFPELSGTEFEERYLDALTNQESVSFKSYYPPLDRWFEEHVYPSETGLSIYFRDITEQKQIEAQLQEIYGRISDAFYALDEEWRFTLLNDQAHELINPEGRDLVGQNVWEEFPAAAERKFKPKYEQAMYEQETVTFEEYYPEPLNAWFEVRAYPSETGLSVYFRDITERKERETELAETLEELRESEERLRLALKAGEMGTWELDLKSNESPERSPEHDRIFGYQEPVEDWSFAVFLEHVHPDDRRDVEERFEEAFETGTWDFECRIMRVDGEQRVISARGEFFYDDDGEPVNAVGVVQDITEQKEQERRLERLVERLEESNERLEQFAYAASHDLQEPLRMVSSYLQLIERRYADNLDESGQEFLDFAVDGANRMRMMIQGLLEYSRIDSRGNQFKRVELDEVFAAVKQDLQVKIEENGADVTADNLPAVKGDANQLRQVLQNLIANAIEYRSDEPPRIHVDAARGGARWVVSVHDNGIGIDPKNQAKVFDVFQRLHSRDEHAGTGIGLALCERIIERHGGEIWVESEPGVGATFSFTLPSADGTAT